MGQRVVFETGSRDPDEKACHSRIKNNIKMERDAERRQKTQGHKPSQEVKQLRSFPSSLRAFVAKTEFSSGLLVPHHAHIL
jgi:hypothetical protein